MQSDMTWQLHEFLSIGEYSAREKRAVYRLHLWRDPVQRVQVPHGLLTMIRRILRDNRADDKVGDWQCRQGCRIASDKSG